MSENVTLKLKTTMLTDNRNSNDKYKYTVVSRNLKNKKLIKLGSNEVLKTGTWVGTKTDLLTYISKEIVTDTNNHIEWFIVLYDYNTDKYLTTLA